VNEKPPPEAAPIYVGIDGGMARVDGVWQECKLACLFAAEDRAQISKNRQVLVQKDVVGVRGTPEDLARLLGPCLRAKAGLERLTMWLGDGAPWIWRLTQKLAPDAVQLLDWYHADEHLSQVARVLYEKEEERRERWRAQRNRSGFYAARMSGGAGRL
jgi:hypothetical protein